MTNKLNTKFLLFFVVLISSIALVPAVLANTLRVEDVTASPGQSITILVSLDNTEDVSGFQFDLDYPSILTYNGYQVTARAPNSNSNLLTSINSFRVAVLPSYSTPVTPGTGAVLELNFTVSGSASPDYYDLLLSTVKIGDRFGTPLTVVGDNGVLTIIDNIPPELEIKTEGTQGNNNWYISIVGWTIRAYDTMSGVLSLDHNVTKQS